MRSHLVISVVCLALLLSQAHAQQTISPDIAMHAATDLKQMSPPGTEVTIVDPLTLKIKGRSGVEFQLNLDNINAVCLGDPGHCDIALADFIHKVAEMTKERDTPTTRIQLRAVVRPNDYVAGLKQMMRGPEPIATPLFDDLSIVCYFDKPTSMSIATDKDLKTLGLSAPAAIELCKKNVAASLPSLASQVEPLPEQIGALPEDPYQSSRLIFHDDWEPIAAKYGGNLIVAVPAANVVVYGPWRGKESVDAMATLAKKLFKQAQMPISQEVFRWTRTGWEVASH